MLTVLTLMVAMSVHAMKDTLEMEHFALVLSIVIVTLVIYASLWHVFFKSMSLKCQCITISADINECIEYLPCDVNANCTNTKGTFNCKCNRGYTGDGMNCSSMSQAHTYISPM